MSLCRIYKIRFFSDTQGNSRIIVWLREEECFSGLCEIETGWICFIWNWRDQPNRKDESLINSATWLGNLCFCGAFFVSIWMSTGAPFGTQWPWAVVAGGGMRCQWSCLLWALLAEGRGFGQAGLADSFPVVGEHIRQKNHFLKLFSVSPN